jgi:hypothetical protein
VLFAAAYAAMNLGAFVVVALAGRELRDITGLGRSRPASAGAAMVVFLIFADLLASFLETLQLLIRKPPLGLITALAEVVSDLGKPIFRSATIRSPLLPRRSASSSRSDWQHSPRDRKSADHEYGLNTRLTAPCPALIRVIGRIRVSFRSSSCA